MPSRYLTRPRQLITPRRGAPGNELQRIVGVGRHDYDVGRRRRRPDRRATRGGVVEGPDALDVPQLRFEVLDQFDLERRRHVGRQRRDPLARTTDEIHTLCRLASGTFLDGIIVHDGDQRQFRRRDLVGEIHPIHPGIDHHRPEAVVIGRILREDRLDIVAHRELGVSRVLRVGGSLLHEGVHRVRQRLRHRGRQAREQ